MKTVRTTREQNEHDLGTILGAATVLQQWYAHITVTHFPYSILAIPLQNNSVIIFKYYAAYSYTLKEILSSCVLKNVAHVFVMFIESIACVILYFLCKHTSLYIKQNLRSLHRKHNKSKLIDSGGKRGGC